MSDPSEIRDAIRREVGARLTYLRKRAGLSTAAVGDRLGVSAQTIRSWESGKHTPTADYLSMLVELFDITTDFLVRRTDKRKRWFYDEPLAKAQQDSEDPADACWRRGKPFFDVDEHVRLIDDDERQELLDGLAAHYKSIGGPPDPLPRRDQDTATPDDGLDVSAS